MPEKVKEKETKMAIPIKHTPEISGRDSKRFNEEIEKNNDNTISVEQYERMSSIVNKFE